MEIKVRLVMAPDGGKELRQRIATIREMAIDALKEGGSSVIAFDEFLTDL